MPELVHRLPEICYMICKFPEGLLSVSIYILHNAYAFQILIKKFIVVKTSSFKMQNHLEE